MILKKIHPEKMEVILEKKRLELEKALQEKTQLKSALEAAIQSASTTKELSAISKAEKKYYSLIERVEVLQREYKKLQEEIKTQISFYNDDESLFDHLIGTENHSLRTAYSSIIERKKQIEAEAIAISKIEEVAKEVLAMDKRLASKKIIGKKRKVNSLLQEVQMSPEERLALAKRKRVETLKKTFGGLGVVGVIGGFIFPVGLVPYAVGSAVAGLLGYSAMNTKAVEKAIIGEGELLPLVTQSLQEYAYGGEKKTIPRSNGGAVNSKPQRGNRNPTSTPKDFGGMEDFFGGGDYV